MSFGKMNGFADIIKTKQVKDNEGFTTTVDETLASIRVYREGRHGSENGPIVPHLRMPPTCSVFV